MFCLVKLEIALIDEGHLHSGVVAIVDDDLLKELLPTRQIDLGEVLKLVPEGSVQGLGVQ